jgi:hypothetical protein
VITRIEGPEGGIAEGAADTTRTELDSAEKPRNNQQSFEIALAQELQELHSRLAHLTVIPDLFDQTPVLVPNPARPAVVAGLVVPLFALGELFFDLAKVFGKCCDPWHTGMILDAGCWMLDAGCWMRRIG